MNEHTEASLEATHEKLGNESAGTGNPSRRRLLWICAAVAIFAVIAWIIHHGRQAQAGGPGARGRSGGAMAVAVATAVVGDIAVRLPALGTVTPLATVTVKTQISGQLQQIAFKEGQLVRQGDFLAQIDPRPYQAALAQSQGNLQRDQSLLTNARVDLKRYQGLAADNTIAKQQLDTQQALVQPVRGHRGHGHGAAEPGKTQPAVHAHRVAGDGPRGPAAGGPGQLRHARRRQRHRGGHAAAARIRAVSDARRQPAGDPEAPA